MKDKIFPEAYAKAEQLLEEIRKSIKSADTKKARYKFRAVIIKVLILFLTTSATILLGLNITGFESIFKEIAFVLGAIATSLTAIDPFLNWTNLWHEHESKKASFYRLKERTQFYMKGKKPEDYDMEIIQGLFDEFQNEWVDLNNSWRLIRKSSSSPEQVDISLAGNK